MSVRRDRVIEEYHGMKIADPYRWLEDSHLAYTKAWIERQNEITRTYLDSITERSRIKERLNTLWDYPKFSVPEKVANKYFYLLNPGLKNQAVLYMQTEFDSKPMTVLDPNRLSDDGTVALTNFSFSKDGTLLAYATSQSGSDWQEIRVLSIGQDKSFDDVVRWCKFRHIAWTPDNSGFFYSRYPESGTVAPEDASNFNKVYFHRLGTVQATDELIFECPDNKELGFSPYVTEDGRYFYLIVTHGTDPRNRFYYRPIGGGSFVKLLDDYDASYYPIGNLGDVFYFHTDYQSPKGRIIAIDLTNPDRSQWWEVVAETDDVVDYVSLVNNQLVVVYLHDAHHEVKLYDMNGVLQNELELPTIGSVGGVSGNQEDTEMFLSFTSYLYPTTVFRYDFASRELEQAFETRQRFNPEDFETHQVFCTSKDGTQVPIFITHKKGLRLDGNNPTILYGYGGFNINMTPNFAPDRLIWLENGGVYAVACLRGGNEYGEEWHQAGRLGNKQNVFNDFISAAEWLIANDYTSPSKLAISGRSNGGLLVAACMLQRPDLYGAVICGVPVIDMLRFHRFTAGRFWTTEYGNAEADPEQFRSLFTYSPLHNVKQNLVYPPILITTADTDDRVVPMHSFKFAATLQAAAAPGSNSILLRVETKAGHGAGKPTAKVIEEWTDVYGFLFRELGVD